MKTLSDWNPPESDLENVNQAGESGRCEYCGDPATDITDHGQVEIAGKFYHRVDAFCAACAKYGAPCYKCGERCSLKHGDENDCRSADCLSAKADAMEDR